MNTPETTITLCMGSSCFSRGNNNNAEMLSRYIQERGLAASIEVQGCLCEGHCKGGPNIKINGELFQGVSAEMLFDLLDHTLAKAHV